MIKLICCITKRSDMTREEFHDYWFNKHAPLVRAAQEVLGIKHYVQNFTVHSEFSEAIREQRGLSSHEHDGVAELWFESEEALAKALSTTEAQKHAEILVADEAKFIDFSKSHLYFSQEDIVINNQ